jgi:hypothetical protein
MSQKSLAQWLGNLLSATALALPYVASLVKIQNYIRIRYYLNYLLFTSFFHRHHTAKYVDEQLQRVISSVQ